MNNLIESLNIPENRILEIREEMEEKISGMELTMPLPDAFNCICKTLKIKKDSEKQLIFEVLVCAFGIIELLDTSKQLN
jgi:hypothetical protein